ncbi:MULTISPECIES: CBS domain-containing protein [unclassified Plantactinospora]|uniref:CBS domain-containing protein n=1 Tax=unclassified Plantactinospora TaxID=2631981 RepID=UPI000D1588CB|nr:MULTISPECIES: CBS domain-containing protein [unclassified Plantactinospora]AVT30974.1 CBS domain-containing protein [Plantactinospora sp. BC1]AVT39955.1 CBS domain-containing protein [Plantactinospora sp. BB1]
MTEVRVRDVMTRTIVYLPAATTLDEAARAMRDADIGDVVVTDGPSLFGMVTDRDIVVRAVAEGSDARQTTIGSVTSREIVMIEQNSTAAEAAALMRERAVRRILVCDSDRQLVGIVSLGDLAVRLDPSSALSEISEASPRP